MSKIRKGSFVRSEEGNLEKGKIEGRVKANYNLVLSLNSAELGRNLHLARITQRGKGGTQENSC